MTVPRTAASRRLPRAKAATLAFAICSWGSPTPGAEAKSKVLKLIEVQGHRGARAKRPENTGPAFEYALAAGVDVLELDLMVTKDDRLVVTHDPILNAQICLSPLGERLDGARVVVRATTFSELSRYDCGTLKHPRFPGQVPAPNARIPALEEVFELLKRSPLPAAKRVSLNLEIKSVPGQPELFAPPEKTAELLVRALKKADLVRRATVQSFDHRTLSAVRALEPSLVLAALISDNYLDFVAAAHAVGATIVSPDQLWITKEAVDRLHRAGMRVIPWTANEEKDWQRLIELGADGIITDDPEALITWLSARGMR